MPLLKLYLKSSLSFLFILPTNAAFAQYNTIESPSMGGRASLRLAPNMVRWF